MGDHIPTQRNFSWRLLLSMLINLDDEKGANVKKEHVAAHANIPRTFAEVKNERSVFSLHSVSLLFYLLARSFSVPKQRAQTNLFHV